MTEVINLRQARKQRNRAAHRAAGDTNAAKFGETRSERTLRAADKQRRDQALDGHYLASPGTGHDTGHRDD